MGKIHVVKRADAVIRWVERLKKSYSAGDTNNAYIEAECARADIEALTHDVIASISRAPKISSTRCIIPVLRVISLSLAVIMSWAYPISRDVNAPGMASEPVAVRHEEVRQDTQTITPRETVKATTRRKSSKPATKPTTPKATQPDKPATKPNPSKPAKTPAYDRLAHLTLTGQKALNNHKSTIITERSKL